MAPHRLAALHGPPLFRGDTEWSLSNGEASQANVASARFRTNDNAVEFFTAATPAFIFENYLRRFDGINSGSIAKVSAPQGGVTGIGQEVAFQMLHPLLQGVVSNKWFAVETIRFDEGALTLAARTLPGHPLLWGHPLDGWRYWRASQPAPGRVRIETGAYDRPADGILNLALDYVFRDKQVELWQQYFQYITDRVEATPYDTSRLAGRWNEVDKSIIMSHVCGHPPTPAGTCQ